MTGPGELTSAISRLEQVTERLLRFEASLAGKGGSGAAATAPNGGSHAAAAAANGGGSTVSTAGGRAGAGAGGLASYEKLLDEQLKPFMAQAAALGGEVLDASKLVEQAFQEQYMLLRVASKAKQPAVPELQQLLGGVGQHMMAASALADNRRSSCFNQNKVVAEALQALSWLAYTGHTCGMHPPAQHISESWNSAEFYANKLFKEFRGVDDTQVAWAKALKDLFTALQAFVRLNMPNGLAWNAAGTSVAEAQAAAKAAGSGPAAAAAPAPPAAAAAPAKAQGAKAPPAAPPPPAGLGEMLLKERPGKQPAAAAAAGGTAAGGGGMQEVLKALSQGTSVTSGLRKVTDDMKSKNRADRSGHVATAPTPAAAGKAAPPAAAAAARGPPRLELEQERKWVVENQTGQQELVVTITDARQSVYIYNCSGSVVQVKGKCNAISIDKCTKTGVVFEDVIASCELVNCTSVQVQCTGTAPTLSIDKCDGVQAYIPAALAKDPNFQVVSAKSSEMNLVLVAADPSAEDVVEHPLPEQYVSSFRGGKLVTTAASHGGG